jgi:hypothetical protein
MLHCNAQRTVTNMAVTDSTYFSAVSCVSQRDVLRKGNIWPVSILVLWPGIAQSVQRLATGWTVEESNSGGNEIFRTSSPALGPTQPPAQLVQGLFLGRKTAGSLR